MSGWKPGLIALTLLAWPGTWAEAQGVVPGGWAPQFGFQSFVAPGSGGGGYLGFGVGSGVPAAGFMPYGMGGFATYGPPALPPSPSYSSFTASSQTVNAINPLIGAIRRSTGRKGNR